MAINEDMRQELDGIIEFLKIAEQLKSTTRSAHSSTGRHESVAEHTWRLCLLALLLSRYYPKLDLVKLLKMLLIHDMGEIIGGDIPAIHQDPTQNKNEQERSDFQKILAPLPEDMREEFLSIWDEYDQVVTPEAKLAKALDKLETLLQHVQGDNPKHFDYGFNLDYGSQYTGLDGITTYIREQLDNWTRQRMSE